MKAATGQQAGMNQQKFEALFSKYREVVYKTAYSMTGRKQEAMDIQQTIFLRLIDNGETLESVPNPKAYLCRAAMNEARQRFRSRRRQKYSDDDVERFIDPSSDRSRGEEDMRQRPLEALARMEPEHSEMLILWSVHGYTDKDSICSNNSMSFTIT